ncbi:MAG: H-NS histone family protein [Pseudomonadota bacterium]
MSYNLSSMEEKDLLKLREDIDKALKDIEKNRRDTARKAVEAAAKKHGFTLNDLVGTLKKSPAKPKYRNPDDPSQTWSGRGRQPTWFKEAMNAGEDISRFEV